LEGRNNLDDRELMCAEMSVTELQYVPWYNDCVARWRASKPLRIFKQKFTTSSYLRVKRVWLT